MFKGYYYWGGGGVSMFNQVTYPYLDPNDLRKVETEIKGGFKLWEKGCPNRERL